MRNSARFLVVFIGCLSMGAYGFSQQPFSNLVGNTSVKSVESKQPIEIPFITWGGDVATFLANGGLTTQPGSIYDKLGLKIKLTPGDDFISQTRNYMGGKTPFVRGTMRMMGQASEVLGRNPNTKPAVVLQLSWSAGDHIVSRENLKTLNDLRGKGKKVKIACQQGGPHVGLLYDSLDAAKISREEVEIVWVEELTGSKGPADAFRKDSSIDACCVITPDMIGLTGGPDEQGSGAEGTVKGAHVLNSTATMSRSIADVYCVRNDWYKKNRDFVSKFAAGYLKATEDLVKMRQDFEKSKRMSGDYEKILKMSQSIFGNEVINSLEVDGHGLLLDCSFVGLPGQIAFFEDRGNLNGFEGKMSKSLDLATNWGYARIRSGFDPSGFDYRAIAKTAGVEYVKPNFGKSIGGAETIDFGDEGQIDEKTLLSFTISFEPNQATFPADRYGGEFNRAIEAASTFGNAVVLIRGHADPTKALNDMLRGGMKKGLIKQTGTKGNYRYYLQGNKLDLTQTDKMIKLIQSGAFTSGQLNAKETVASALNLSKDRAKAVKESMVSFAKKQGVNLNADQIQPDGAGISDPIIRRPKNMTQAKENMRVEFRIIRVPAEALGDDAFSF